MPDRLAILYVDDEERSLKYFKKIFGETFHILTALNGQEAYKTLEENRDLIGILMTDQRMPGEKGTRLLERVRRFHPRILRFLVTAYSDLDAAIEAVNKGAIYKYITKPWDIPQLEIALRQGLESFMIQRQYDLLLKEETPDMEKRVTTEGLISLGVLSAGVSRYLQKPAAAIKSFLDMVPDKIKEENFAHVLSKNPLLYLSVRTQTNRILMILKGLEEGIQRTGYKSSQLIYLHNIVSQVIEQKKKRVEQKKIEIENHIPDSMPPLKIDRESLYRLFDLLLEDEIVSLPKGGEIRLTARLIHSPATQIQIEIEDNGPELPQWSSSRLFEPFLIRSHNPQELGLNLTKCFFIIHNHGGNIAAKINKKKGTTFTIIIPIGY